MVHKPGEVIQLVGLAGAPELNGQSATVVGWDAAHSRYGVCVKDSGRKIAVQPANALGAADSLGVQQRLWRCIDDGDLESARALVQHRGGDASSANQMKVTCLHRAARLPGPPGVAAAAFLLESGADAAAQDVAGCTPLHYAATHSVALVELLLAHGASAAVAAVEGGGGRTPLHYCAMAAAEGGAAVQEEQARVYGLLVAKGASPSAEDSDGVTPQALMAQKGRSRMP